jgi:hypothetical protein
MTTPQCERAFARFWKRSALSTGVFHLSGVSQTLRTYFYSPLAAGLLQPYRADSKLQHHKRTQLDRLYQKIVDDLDELLGAVGLKAPLLVSASSFMKLGMAYQPKQ